MKGKQRSGGPLMASNSVLPLPNQSEGIRKKVLELRDTILDDYLSLAELLSTVRHQGLYLQWGFATFSAYCDEELGFKERKAQHYINIWEKVKAFKLDAKRIQKIGWTKLRAIFPAMNKSNAEQLIQKAEKLPVRKLEEEMKSLKPAAKTISTVTLNLPMQESQYRIILSAINEAKRLAEKESISWAMEMICQDWMAGKGGIPELSTLEDHIAYLEEIYGVKIKFTSGKKNA